jgi:site-specific DNA-adenine methylase
MTTLQYAVQTQFQPGAAPLWVGTTTTLTLTPAHTPTFAYPGGKCRLATTIVSFMPTTGGTYLEPFAGRGNVFFRAAATLQYCRWHLNDIRMAPFFDAIISHGNTIQVPEHTRREFELQKAAHHGSDPIAILLAPYLTYSGAGYAAGYRAEKGSPLRHHYQSTLRCAHQILIWTRPSITNVDWKLAVADLGEDDFAYFDPPYLGAKVHGYGVQDMNHAEMIDVLKSARFRWLLSEYEHPLYLKAFGQPFWRKNVQLCATNFGKNIDHGRARRVECLWRNY